MSTRMRAEGAEYFKIDPVHEKIDIMTSDLVRDVWQSKYRYGDEESPQDSFMRVCDGVYVDDLESPKRMAYEAMCKGLWMPAGRIQAGAGTDKHVTLMNCFVNSTLVDSMEGISAGLESNMLTLRMGGGNGTDFSPLRPKYAKLERLGEGAHSSGPVSFMEIWDAACKTIMSAGARRGAMMGTIADSHPDLLEFVHAKQEAGKLTQFNVSVLISDAFMDAVKHGEDWQLYFHVPPTHKEPLGTFEDDDGVTQYVYERHDARDLWNAIIENTYKYSEPGVIFIDRVNDLNNLNYCEEIRATNPCGEQPLPPDGCCLLGALNLARMVENPFKPGATFDWNLLDSVVPVAVRFLDNVIDVTKYPLPGHEQEELNKRRIGLGISGLADAMMQLGLRYGSTDSEAFTRRIMRTIAERAYEASMELARERGPFPLYNQYELCSRPFVKKLPKGLQDMIARHGLRNGVLLTIAPTGTTSVYYGDISSGLEPVFAFESKRNVLQPDGTTKPYMAKNYGIKVYEAVIGKSSEYQEVKPNWMVDVQDLSVTDHVRIQAAAQDWIDASVSKTINCPENIPFEEFKEVYSLAYDLGCKGCTTYRPSATRGAVLEAITGAGAPEVQHTRKLPDRPESLEGTTYKINWSPLPSAIYLTINHDEAGRPHEVFISSKSGRGAEWMTALTLMISAIMRLTDDIDFIPTELQQVVSAHETNWIDGRKYSSLVARIGAVLQQHLDNMAPTSTDAGTIAPEAPQTYQTREGEGEVIVDAGSAFINVCPSCGSIGTQVAQEGCMRCTVCNYSDCS